MNWIGLDIGGANLKIAKPDQPPLELSFPMWQEHQALPDLLKQLLSNAPASHGIAVTMTGELADCFGSKQDGVHWIVDSVTKATGRRAVVFYQTDGSWCDGSAAKLDPLKVAAANWHALATFSARFLSSENGFSGFMIDIGSTTTDIIPLINSLPTPGADQPVTDLKRMTRSQLVYSGVWRSPLNSLLTKAQIDGHEIQLANELFATIADAYIWRGLIAEDANNCDTADARPATRPCAGQRLARMACSDFDEIAEKNVDVLADLAIAANQCRIGDGIRQVVSSRPALPLEFIVSGSGSWLAEQILISEFPNSQLKLHRLSELLDPQTCRSAAAYAVMRLANEQLPNAVT